MHQIRLARPADAAALLAARDGAAVDEYYMGKLLPSQDGTPPAYCGIS